jgi:ATP-dependent helicase/nuclease subunit A
VVLVDYKSDANPPGDDKPVPAAYAAQLGLYAMVAGQLFPGKKVEAAILWTELESLRYLPSDQLREAVAGFTIG